MTRALRKVPRSRGARRPTFPWTEPPAAGQRLREILWPLEPAEFLREHWARRPLLIRGWADKFSGLFGFDQLERLLARMERHPEPLGPTLRAFGPVEQLSIRPEQIKHFYRPGSTICMTAIQRWDETLSLLCEAVQRDLNYPGSVQCNAYWATDKGFAPLHFDARIATTLQISGRKRWRYADHSSVPWPRRNASALYNKRKGGYTPTGKDPTEAWERFKVPPERDLKEVVLEPGDFLCLPAGTFHDVEAIGHSLAINLAFEPAPFWDLVGPELARRLSAREAWRSAPPSLEDWQEGGVPGHVSQYLEERLGELQAVMEELRQAPALVERWRAAVVARKDRVIEAPTISIGPKRPRPPRAPVSEDQVLGFAHTTLCQIDTKGSKVWVTLRDGKSAFLHETDAQMVEFFRRIVREGSFTAGAARRWVRRGERPLPWPKVQATLDELVEAGALRCLPDPPRGPGTKRTRAARRP